MKNGEIHFYDFLQLITSEKATVIVAEIDNESIASGYAVIKKEVDEIRLQIFDENIAAKKAYQKMGFNAHMLEIRLGI